MDPLSDVLSLLRVQSSLSARLEARGGWAMRFPPYRHVKFGGVLKGSFWLWVEGASERTKLKEGDFYLLTSGQPYCSASDPDQPCQNGRQIFDTCKDADGVVRFGNGDEQVIAVGGRFEFDDSTSDMLLRQLPPLIHLPAASQRSRSLRAILELLASETEAVQPGAALTAGSIASLVLVQILRTHLETASSRPASWLRALTDPHIGAALCLMHGDPARPWRIEDLAVATAMSRTTFMQRFKTLVGLPPLEYLLHWRMTLASARLRDGRESLSQVAESVGYGSSSAFSLAFKRTTGQSPGHFRAEHKVDEDDQARTKFRSQSSIA